MPALSPIPHSSVASLISPRRKYVGIAVPGGETGPPALSGFAARVGRYPDMSEIYVDFNQPFPERAVRTTYGSHALTMINWQPTGPSVAQIAAGADDIYIKSFAQSARQSAVPVVLAFGHEMNGDWYPWGSSRTNASAFVSAFRHVHDVFDAAGAGNVIWLWTVSALSTQLSGDIGQYYPGDSYVDWVGIDGYFRSARNESFSDVFDSTFSAVRRFTGKAILIAEVASVPTATRPDRIRGLFQRVAADNSVVGLVWFDYDKTGPSEAAWSIDGDRAALAAFATSAADSRFGGELVP
jgi:mannan endo-1,4-beta-mannosidase